MSPGFGELMRLKSFAEVPTASLSLRGPGRAARASSSTCPANQPRFAPAWMRFFAAVPSSH